MRRLVQHPKKLREREVFDAVYLERAPSAVINSERPDFLIRLAPELPLFGVEVAEYFDSEVEARLRRISGYVSHLLEGGLFRHKEDKTELTLEKVAITDADGHLKEAGISAIIQRVPTLEKCSAMVGDVIRTKDLKLDAAFAQTHHVNLVIAGQTNLLSRIESSTFYQLYCLDSLRHAVFASRFREIYFVTSFKSGRVYIPLKLLLTLAQLYFFQATVAQSDYCHGTNTVADFMRLFAAYLANIAVGPVHVRPDSNGLEVMYGDSGFLVAEDLSVTVRSYNDWPWSTSTPVDSEVATGFDVALLNAVVRFERENTFTTEIAFPVSVPGRAG